MNFRLLILLLIAIGLGSLAYWKNSQDRLPLEVLNPFKKNGFLDELHLYVPPPEFEEAIKEAIQSKDFKKLDELGKLYASQRNQSGIDAGNIRRFFDILSKQGTKKTRPSELDFAKEWCTAHPNSAVAKIVHAKLLLNYAWDARGDGFANTVSRSNFELFYERLKKARQLILDIPREEQILYSESFGCLITCAKGLDMPHPRFVKLYLDLAQFTPNCSELHYKAAHFSTKQWGAQPGEWEKNLKLAIADLPPSEADQIYAATFYRMVEQGHWFGDFDNVFKPAKIDSAKLLRGLELLVANSAPESYTQVYHLNALAHAIGEYENNPSRGKNALKKADWQIHLDVWSSEKNFDYYYREWLERRFK